MEIRINYNKVFSILPQIMSMTMEMYRNKWYAPRYIDGSFSTRKDKLVCRMVNDGIQVLEQGGEAMTLFRWMIKYGGCRNAMEAKIKLVGLSAAVIDVQNYIEKEVPLRYVPKEYLERSQEGRIQFTDNFTLFLRKTFGMLEAEHVLKKYKVGRSWQKINATGRFENVTQFWYINKEFHILHDKKILYKDNGKRDRNYGGGRIFTKGKGYSGRCIFGEHLLKNRKEGERVFVVESEKAAIIGSLYFKKGVWVATGGKNNFIREGTEKDWTYLADIDAWEYWSELKRGNTPKWWESFPEWEHGETDDIGDYIIWKKKQIKAE